MNEGWDSVWALKDEFIQAVQDTAIMVGVASSIGIIFGGALGIWLYLSGDKQLFQNRALNAGLNWVISFMRAFPFVILMIALMPVTRAIVGLTEHADKYPSQLSGGQKQRVGIARALAPRPNVILADEPTSALDPITTRSVLQCLKDINERFNVTIVIVTHEMSVIRRICNRVALLDDGHLVEVVKVENKQLHPQSVVGQELVRED